MLDEVAVTLYDTSVHNVTCWNHVGEGGPPTFQGCFL